MMSSKAEDYGFRQDRSTLQKLTVSDEIAQCDQILLEKTLSALDIRPPGFVRSVLHTEVCRHHEQSSALDRMANVDPQQQARPVQVAWMLRRMCGFVTGRIFCKYKTNLFDDIIC